MIEVSRVTDEQKALDLSHGIIMRLPGPSCKGGVAAFYSEARLRYHAVMTAVKYGVQHAVGK
jgi:hypothetical protein